MSFILQQKRSCSRSRRDIEGRGALIPLIMPPDIPSWILVLSRAFAVITGKEAFYGVQNEHSGTLPLLSRVFVFCFYPLTIAGDQCWISGFEKSEMGHLLIIAEWHTGF
ncbi:MAG: RnfABCDGE type electron transport complex subunit D [Saprospiraceae bacterium]|nr:RnfABCDGE type electron transport complex subunit D [Saprospiraceae bacterium]